MPAAVVALPLLVRVLESPAGCTVGGMEVQRASGPLEVG